MLGYQCDTCGTIAWEGVIRHPEVLQGKQCCPDCYSEALIDYPASDDWKALNIKELGLVQPYIRALARYTIGITIKLYKETGCVEVKGMHPCLLCDQFCKEVKLSCIRPCG